MSSNIQIYKSKPFGTDDAQPSRLIGSLYFWIDRAEHLIFPYKIAECGLKWSMALCSDSMKLAQMNNASKRITLFMQPMIALKVVKASCRLFQSAYRLEQAVMKPSRDHQDVQKAANAVFIDALKWLEKECKLLILLDKKQILHLSKYCPIAPKLLIHTAFFVSTVVTCIDLNTNYKKYNNLDDRNSCWQKRKVKIELSHCVTSCISASMLGASLYLSIYFPPLFTLAFATFCLAMDTIKELPSN